MNKIIVYEPNWLGDVLFTSPALRAIKEVYPESHLACIAHPRTTDVLSCIPYVDEIIPFSEKGWIFHPSGVIKFIRSIKIANYDIGILFHPSDSRALFLKLAGIKNLVGWKNSGVRSLLLDNPVEFEKDDRHRIDMYLSIVKPLGIAAEDKSYAFKVPDEARRYIEVLLDGFKDYVVINPGGNWPAKRWPLENYAQLAERIIDKLGLGIVISGAQGDVWLAEKLYGMIRQDRIFIAAGKTTIRQLAALLEGARAVISNDSGPLHIASAVNKNCIGVFGPTDPKITGLLSLNAVNLFAPPDDCRIPCYRANCAYDYKCIRSVSVEMVFNELSRILSV